VKNTWIGDSGASIHMVNNLNGVTEIEEINDTVTLGDGRKVEAPKRGVFHGVVKKVDGSTKYVSLKVNYVPSLWINLLSITHAIKNGMSLTNDADSMILTNGSCRVKLDRKLSNFNDHTMTVYIEPINNESMCVSCTTEERKKMEVNDLHALLGHVGEAKLRDTAQAINITLTGKFEDCEYCGVAKEKLKRIDKTNDNKTNIPGYRIYVDVSTIEATSAGGKKHWMLIVDESTSYKWSFFLKKKLDLLEQLVEFLKSREQTEYPVQRVRMDNSGENKYFQSNVLNKEDYLSKVKVEFTAPGTPMQNGVVERAFPTILGRVRAMMKQAGFDQKG
jgi:hypothetical protein